MSGTTHRPLDLMSSRPHSTEHHDAIRKALLSAGALSSLLYVITADGVAASMWDGYRRTEQMVSDLFAVGSPGREATIPLMWLYTVLFVVFGIGVWISVSGNRRLRIGGALLIAYGASNIVAGFFPLTLNDDASVPMHIVVTNLQLSLMVAAMCFVAAGFHGRMRLYSIASLVTSTILGIVSFTAAPGPSLLLGIGERISIGAFLLWVAVLAVALWNPPRPSANDTAQAGHTPRTIRAYDWIYERCAGHPRHQEPPLRRKFRSSLSTGAIRWPFALRDHSANPSRGHGQRIHARRRCDL